MVSTSPDFLACSSPPHQTALILSILSLFSSCYLCRSSSPALSPLAPSRPSAILSHSSVRPVPGCLSPGSPEASHTSSLLIRRSIIPDPLGFADRPYQPWSLRLYSQLLLSHSSFPLPPSVPFPIKPQPQTIPPHSRCTVPSHLVLCSQPL